VTAEYLKNILATRVYDVAVVTPLDHAPSLSRLTGNRVYLKREDTQPVFSFKLRGAYNKMAGLAPAERRRGVICASAGNHAQGVALSAARLQCSATIVMPVTTPALKVDAVKQHGGTFVDIVLHGESYSDAARHASILQAERQASFIHPFDDPDVICGQGTVGMEILHQHPGPIHAIFVAVGGGGLIAGVGAYVKACRPDTKIIGVQTRDSNAMARSIEANERVSLPQVGLFSDGTAVRLVGKETFRIAQQVVDEFILVDTDDICTAIEDVFKDTRAILEPSGALAVAGMKAYTRDREALGKPVCGQTLVAIASGANIDFSRLQFVSERAGKARNHPTERTLP